MKLNALTTLALATTGGAAFAQSSSLSLMPSGVVKDKIHFYMPHNVQLSGQKPAVITKVPDGLSNLLFGQITFAGKPVTFALGTTADGSSKLLIDANGDGDLTNDPATTWDSKPYPQGANFKMHAGTGQVNLTFAGKSQLVTLGLYMFDPADTQRSKFKNTIFYYSDYAATGKAQIGKTAYDVLVVDVAASGTFTAKPAGPNEPPSVLLLVDRAQDGNYGIQADQFDPTKPLKIDGQTLQPQIAADGSTLAFTPSTAKVEEIPVPPSLGAGKPALPFKATTTAGDKVSFPTDYHGKIVLLDFWATWCGPCMGEAPNVVANYKKYHPRGFEILGISLDNPDTAKNVASVTKDKGMTWKQVCDQKFWSAAVAQLYGIQSIPQAFLVDGDTGKILAGGDDIRGENLGPAIEKALASKAGAKTPSK